MRDAMDVSHITDGGGLLDQVPLPFVVPVGSAEISLAEVLTLGAGSTIELDAGVDAPVNLVVNGIAVATGRLVLAEGNFAVRIESVEEGIGQTVLGDADGLTQASETVIESGAAVAPADPRASEDPS